MGGRSPLQKARGARVRIIYSLFVSCVILKGSAPRSPTPNDNFPGLTWSIVTRKFPNAAERRFAYSNKSDGAADESRRILR